ncbi:xanthine dehydrogenase [Hwanghaeella grinnelliae]|uniref:Xanthine dehydrogenase n=1 Tax=Hwanghaeella grinnelliae TaxID=2500179 RepID=A0A437QJU0_9PROT|nr:XdhC family protein [Hwanghaeella grinnelliae]RVU34777.1 xanthine dehydrogenase [Hwanghaeella grinnelliae]
MKRIVLKELRRARDSRVPATLVTDLSTGAQTLIVGEAFYGDPLPDASELEQVIDQVMVKDKGRTIEAGDSRIFIQPFNPPLRMMIIGAVHISQALAPMAKITGYDVTVIDPRTAWATEERFPGVVLDQRWPDEVMEETPPDRGTAVVTLTHDPKIDDPALEVALRSDAFYIGALGGSKTNAKREERLKESGLTAEQIARLHAPVGLDLGSVSPAEIAVATLAQATLALRGPRRKG